SLLECKLHFLTRLVEVPVFQPIQELGGQNISGYPGHRKLFHCSGRIAGQRRGGSNVNPDAQYLKIPDIRSLQKESRKFTVFENKVIRRLDLDGPTNRALNDFGTSNSSQSHK